VNRILRWIGLLSSGRARPLPAALTILVATAVLAGLSVPMGAQQPKEPTPKAPPAQPKAGQPKSPTAQPKAAPTPPPAVAPPQSGFVPAEQLPKLNYTPWTKYCMKPPGADANARQVCFTGTDAQLENGRAFVSAVIIEPEGEPRKILKVMLPHGLQIPPGTRVSVDQGQPMTAPYAICFANGCFADYEATADLVSRMKQGQILVIQGLTPTQQVLSISIPLTDFAKGYDGPPVDTQAIEEQQKKAQEKLQEELERRAKELSKGASPPPDKAQ
jgi:invasion protein IalB